MDAQIRIRITFRALIEQTKVPVETNRLHKDQRNGASVFEIEFLISNERFRYGFAVSGKGIEEEWLFRKRIKGLEARIFTREGQNITPNSPSRKWFKAFCATHSPQYTLPEGLRRV